MKKETIRTIFFTVIIIIGSVWFIRFFIIEPDLLSVSVMQRSAKLSFRLGLHGGMCVSARGDCLGEPPFWAASLHNTLYFTNSQTFAIGYII